jgi:hypothetical protein
MLKYLRLEGVGLAPRMQVDWAERLNVIVGDNGLGKSFLLDLSWWALTRTWAGQKAIPPRTRGAPKIEYVVKGKTRAGTPVKSAYRLTSQSWPLPAARPTMPGIVVYIRVDGGFSVWDPARNYWRDDPQRPEAYHFQASEVWDGLTMNEERVCEGLERDWVSWQDGRKPQFSALEAVLKVLSPPDEPLTVGPPQKLFAGEGRNRPTLIVAGQAVPLALASSGVRRVLAMAYFLVWAWHEHHEAATLLGKAPESRVVLLFDEPETHLHPRWQRSIMPSLLKAIDVLRSLPGTSQEPAGKSTSKMKLVAKKRVAPPQPQVILATHSPLVAASIEPLFDPKLDDMIHLVEEQGRVVVRQDEWTTQGDVTNWLVSEVFGLEQARSIPAERAIEAAEALMRGETGLPDDLATERAIHLELQRLLPAGDPFWPRWLVRIGKIDGRRGRRS